MHSGSWEESVATKSESRQIWVVQIVTAPLEFDSKKSVSNKITLFDSRSGRKNKRIDV